MVLSGCIWYASENIIDKKNKNVKNTLYIFNRPFSCVITVGQLTGQLNLFIVIHRNLN